MVLYRFWFIRQSRTPFDTRTLVAFAIFVGIMRGALERIFFGVETSGSDILAYIPFYVSLPFFYSALLAVLPRITYLRTLQPVVFATLLGLLPPILDFFLGSHGTHSVFYGYFVIHDIRAFPWFGYSPSQNYPLGEALTVGLTLVFIALYTHSRTQKLRYALIGLLLGYAAYLVYALMIPWFVSFLVVGIIPDRLALEQAGHSSLRQLLYLISAAQVGLAWFINAAMRGTLPFYLRRLLHVVPFLLLTLLGALQAGAGRQETALALLATTATGIAIIAHNDFLRSNDKSKRESAAVTNVCVLIFYTMLLFSGYLFSLLALACFALSVLYHYKYFNARATLLGAMKVEGLWGFLTYFIGIFAGSIKHPNPKTLWTAFLFFGGFSLFSVLKDAKDVQSDRAEGRQTIYTAASRRGKNLRRVHLVLCALLFLGLCFFTVRMYDGVAFISLSLLLNSVATFAAWRSFSKRWFQIFLAVLAFILAQGIIFELLRLR